MSLCVPCRWRLIAVVGLVTLLATSCGKSDSTSSTPTSPAAETVASISISPSTLQLVTGKTSTLTATVVGSRGSTLANQNITWSSSSASVATVSSTGTVTAVDSGRASITAQVLGGGGVSVTSTATVIVVRPITVGISPQLGAFQLPSALAGTAYRYQLTATGGDGKYAFALTEGRLPSGLTLGGDGLIAGTPVGADSGTVTVRVTSAGLSGERAFTVLVYAAGGATSRTGACPDVWRVDEGAGGFATIAAPSTGAMASETCIRVPATSTGRTLIALASDAFAGTIGMAGGDVAPPQVSYEILADRADARVLGSFNAIPNPAVRPGRLLPRIPVPGTRQTAPSIFTWQWSTEVYPTKLVFSGVYVNYYEDTTASVADRGTREEWQAIDARVTAQWQAMDTLYGPTVDLDNDGKFSIVALRGIVGTSAYYSACVLAPSYSGSSNSGDCGSVKWREHAVIPLIGNFRGSTASKTADFIVAPILHETVHHRQHMLTLQIPGRATENQCGLVSYFTPARSTNCNYHLPTIRSQLLAEGMANSVLPILLDQNWTNSCLKGQLLGQCNLDYEPYNNGQFFAAWLIWRAGRSIYPEALLKAFASGGAIDGLKEVTGIGEGSWFAMFLASLMLDDTERGVKLGLEWPGIALSAKRGYASSSQQFGSHPVLRTGAYDAMTLRYGGGTVMLIEHSTNVLVRLRQFTTGTTASAIIVPGTPR